MMTPGTSFYNRKSLDNPTYKCLIGFARTGDGFYIAVNISTLNRFIPVKAVVIQTYGRSFAVIYALKGNFGCFLHCFCCFQ